MAVQAQYPSNVLLLNRNGQDGHDYSLQPQPGGLFLDQSPMIFNNVAASGTTNNNNNNSNNPRKRGREASISTAPMNNIPFSLQQQQQSQQPHQLIDLSQLHNQQPNVVSTGLRLSFGEQQQQQQQLQNHHNNHNHQQQQQLQQFSHSSALLSVLAEDFTSQIKQQRDEIDQFLQAQGEQLRRTLAEKRQRHYRALLGAAEETIARRLREKEAEVEKATRRNAELEARAAQLSVEAQLWQAKARAQEATAASLQAQLHQAMMGCGGGGGGGPTSAHDRRGLDDGGGLSCADGGGGGGQAEDAESAYVDPDRVAAVPGPSCRACRKRVASVVLLPCRHLCLCTDCDRVVQACPLCLSLRNSSVEVFMS